MISALTKGLTFEDFVAQYGDDPRYELINGKLRDLEPAGPHEAIAGHLTAYLAVEILKFPQKWVIRHLTMVHSNVSNSFATI